MDSREPTITEEALLQHSKFIQTLAASLARRVDAEADDLVQETYLAIATRRPQDVEKLRPWLRRVVTGLALRHRHREHRHTEVQLQAKSAENAVDPFEFAEQRDLARQVIQELLKLPEHYRETLLLRHYHGLSHQEIAQREEIALETVTTRLRRGMDQLRDRLRRKPELAAALEPEQAAAGRGAKWLGPVAGMLLLLVAGWAAVQLWGGPADLATPPSIAQSVRFQFDSQMVLVTDDPQQSDAATIETLQSLEIRDDVEAANDGFQLVRRYLDGSARVKITGSQSGVALDQTLTWPVDQTQYREQLGESPRRARPSLDLESLFPLTVAVGDSWKVPPEHLADALSPPDVPHQPITLDAQILKSATFLHTPDTWLTHGVTGDVTIEVTEVREVEGETMVICKVTANLENSLDWMAKPDSIRTTAGLHLEALSTRSNTLLEGELWWHQETGRARLLTLAGDLRVDSQVAATVERNQVSENLDQSSSLQGNVHWQIQVQPEGQ
jgi:RNA polymerase sigma-70 factor (ECF subfamily)